MQFLQVCLRPAQQHTLVPNPKDRVNDVHRCLQQDSADVRQGKLWTAWKRSQRSGESEEDALFQRWEQRTDLGTESTHIFRRSASLREAGFSLRWLQWQTKERKWTSWNISGWVEEILLEDIITFPLRTSWQSKCLEKLLVAARTPIVESIHTGIPKSTSARSALSTIPGSRRWRPFLRILSKWAGGEVWETDICQEDFSFKTWIRKLGLGIGENKVQRLHSHVGESIQQVSPNWDRFLCSKYGTCQQSSMLIYHIYNKNILKVPHFRDDVKGCFVVYSILTQVTQRMFANLSTVVASKVEQFYNLDMKMFGYKPYPSMWIMSVFRYKMYPLIWKSQTEVNVSNGEWLFSEICLFSG